MMSGVITGDISVMAVSLLVVTPVGQVPAGLVVGLYARTFNDIRCHYRRDLTFPVMAIKPLVGETGWGSGCGLGGDAYRMTCNDIRCHHRRHLR